MKIVKFLRQNRTILQKTALLIGTIFLAFILMRNPLLRWYAGRKLAKINSRYHCTLRLDGLQFAGLTGVKVQKALLCSSSGDSLLVAEDINVKPGFWGPAGLSIYPNSIQGGLFRLYLMYDQGKTNWDFLFRSTSQKADTGHSQPPDLALRAQFFSRIFFHFLPNRTSFRRFEVLASYNSIPLKISSNTLMLSSEPFSNLIRLSDDSTDFDLKVEGYLERSTGRGGIKMYPANKQAKWLPFLTRVAATGLAFDTLKVDFKETQRNKQLYKMAVTGEVVRLRVDNRSLSDEIVMLTQAQARLGFSVRKNFLETDSGTSAIVNGLRLPFYASIMLNPHPTIKFNINTGWFPASTLFSALPTGLFDNLRGIRVKGDLSYSLRVELDTHTPDSLVFESHLKQRSFSIVSYGRTPLNLMNGPFLYTAYEKGIPVRSFIVGPENPSFVPLEQIPLHLRNAVMTSEDGGFYQHNGFLPDAFRDAMVANLKAGRFVRGGSTISMQLVKNVFLNRHKTITRKLEEALIVWLIENERITSKDRMFEVYLNIIEWGPLVYGISEASRFYFNKRPRALTLAESVFLAGIIPSPKKFMYYVDSEGRPRPFLQNYFHLMGTKMLAKGFITEDMLSHLDPFSVKITGPAMKYLPPTDTLQADSLHVLLPTERIF